MMNSIAVLRILNQYCRFKDIKSDVCELQQLIDLIHRERKAYDQEGYILSL